MNYVHFLKTDELNVLKTEKNFAISFDRVVEFKVVTSAGGKQGAAQPCHQPAIKKKKIEQFAKRMAEPTEVRF